MTYFIQGFGRNPLASMTKATVLLLQNGGVNASWVAILLVATSITSFTGSIIINTYTLFSLLPYYTYFFSYLLGIIILNKFTILSFFFSNYTC